MTTRYHITARQLRRAGACDNQVAIVSREWPDGAPVTVATARRAIRLGLDVGWLTYLMDAPARRAYREAVAPARRAYDEADTSAWRAYKEAIAPAIVRYLRETFARREKEKR